MKFPISMLRDYVETKLSAEEIGDLLTMAGFELEGIEEVEGDAVLDIKVVSNRGDGLSVFGLSREVLAKDSQAMPTELYRLAVAGFLLGDESDSTAATKTSVKVETDACTRYAARLFEGVKNDASPEWLQKRLRQADQRPLGVLVDLSNYVMLELGQPLHAFDRDTLAEGRIVVRGAKTGEKLTTLNGIEHELSPHHMMICDANRAVAVAGVMGGAETEVSSSTVNVLLESAHFENTSVRRTRKELGLNTDASYRFERSVDPNGVVRGLNRFAQLLEQITGKNSRVAGVVDVFPRPPKSGQVSIRVSRASKLLGMDVSASEVRSYLDRLGFTVTGSGEPYLVESPSWRPDIVREEDLIEEVGRVHGYERIPTVPPQGSTAIGGLQGADLAHENARHALLRCGLVQTISHSLRNSHPLDSPNLERIGPQHPASPEMAYLRSSLWPSLADAASRNGGKDVHLFEVGKVHGRMNGNLVEGGRISILSTGRLVPEHWQKSDSASADFFSSKGMVEVAVQGLGLQPEFKPSSKDPRLHLSRQAEILAGGKSIGIMGQIHPALAQQISLPAETYLAALDLDAAQQISESELQLRSISRNPAVRRDISLLIDTAVPYEKIETAAVSAGGQVLEKIWLTDVYAGKGIPEGKHSLTLSLQLRKQGENFTDEEANQVRDLIVAALVALGGEQR